MTRGEGRWAGLQAEGAADTARGRGRTGYLRRAVQLTRKAREQVRRADGKERLRNHIKTPGLYEGNEKLTQHSKQRSEKIRLLGGKVILITK